MTRSAALDEVDPDPRNVTSLLDRIDGAWEDALRGSAEAQAGEDTPLEAGRARDIRRRRRVTS